MNWKIALGGLVVLTLLTSATTSGEERWVHPKCAPLECTKNGPFLQSDDGTLMTIEKNVIRTSSDGGKTWSTPGPAIYSGMNIGHIGHVGQLLRTRDGALVALYLDFDKYKFSWDNEKGAPNSDCILELWAIRSVDGGKTWVDRQRLLPGYNADFMGFIQTSKGDLVVTCEHLQPELRRWVSCSFLSGDEGKTWKRSNWIDLGGHGHHDGAVEPMVTELSDGRLMMLIRTSLGEFWKAYSEDGGQYWRVIQPSGIDASSAPGWLLRLASGRLVLTWNRKDSEAKGVWPTSNSAGPSFEFPCSGHREELSIAFSEDDGDTWSEPVVIAREPGGQLAYPYILERTPGELWIFTRYTWLPGRKAATPLAVRLTEADFIKETETDAAPIK